MSPKDWDCSPVWRASKSELAECMHFQLSGQNGFAVSAGFMGSKEGADKRLLMHGCSLGMAQQTQKGCVAAGKA